MSAPRPCATSAPVRADVALRPVVLLGAAVTAVLMAVSGRYGRYRDEFYYLASGRHLAAGYVDNPPLTPLIARAEVALLGDSVVALRVVPALAAGLTVVVTGLLARELGAGRHAQTLAAACVAVAAFPTATGHVLSTSTFDVLAWTLLSFTVARALRDGGRNWLAVGVVAGVGLENKALVAAFLAALLVGVLAVGPRPALRGPWPAAGVLVAVVLWAPHLVWQLAHGVPQLAMGRQIATVGNGGSAPRWQFPLFQVLDISPLLVPVWVAGLWALLRDPRLRWARAFAVAYAVLVVGLLVAGGKHYYLVGAYPVLLAAGAAPTLRWVRRGGVAGRGRAAWRAGALGAALVVSAVVVGYLMLPLVPERTLPGTPAATVQPITADTVGWPELVAHVGDVARTLPPEQRARSVVLAQNYGEAGALDDARARGADLPAVFSGHNSYADWGPPLEDATTVVAVGVEEPTLRRWFASVRPAGRLDNAIGLDNDERGRPVVVATGRLAPWSAIWPQLRRLE